MKTFIKYIPISDFLQLLETCLYPPECCIFGYPNSKDFTVEYLDLNTPPVKFDLFSNSSVNIYEFKENPSSKLLYLLVKCKSNIFSEIINQKKTFFNLGIKTSICFILAPPIYESVISVEILILRIGISCVHLGWSTDDFLLPDCFIDTEINGPEDLDNFFVIDKEEQDKIIDSVVARI